MGSITYSYLVHSEPLFIGRAQMRTKILKQKTDGATQAATGTEYTGKSKKSYGTTN